MATGLYRLLALKLRGFERAQPRPDPHHRRRGRGGTALASAHSERKRLPKRRLREGFLLTSLAPGEYGHGSWDEKVPDE
jgi:hypothetical protein